VAKVDADDMAEWIIPLLKGRDLDHLRGELAQRLARDGLERFVVETVPALNRRIGDGWMSGELEIFEEHLYTEMLQNQLRSSIHALGNRGTAPQVLLTTVKDEEHLLGLLMVEALLAANGASCRVARRANPDCRYRRRGAGHPADIVALSFSGCLSLAQGARCPDRTACRAAVARRVVGRRRRTCRTLSQRCRGKGDR
jgi:hypothetical protein